MHYRVQNLVQLISYYKKLLNNLKNYNKKKYEKEILL